MMETFRNDKVHTKTILFAYMLGVSKPSGTIRFTEKHDNVGKSAHY